MNNDILQMNGACIMLESTSLGTKINNLYIGLTSSPKEKYNGDLLSDDEINKLNNMCNMARSVNFGSLINNILSASKNGTELENIDDELIDKINLGFCPSLQKCLLGNKLYDMIDIINSMAIQPEAKILSYSVGDIIGNIDNENHTITVDFEERHPVDLTSIISTFTLSEGAIAKIGDIEQISGETINDFSEVNPITYSVISKDGITTENWDVEIIVSEHNLIEDGETYPSSKIDDYCYIKHMKCDIDGCTYTEDVQVPHDFDKYEDSFFITYTCLDCGYYKEEMKIQ